MNRRNKGDQNGGGITRRGVLAGAALFGVGAGIDRLVGDSGSGGRTENSDGAAVPFHGSHQAGIATPAQEFVNLAAFDMKSDASEDLRTLLQGWTEAAAALTAGSLYEPSSATSSQPPPDPAEARDLGPAQLTITVGFGPSLFASRLGLARRRPAALRGLPSFRGESLDPHLSDGDLCVQACADDPQVAFHAIHVFARIAADVATLLERRLDSIEGASGASPELQQGHLPAVEMADLLVGAELAAARLIVAAVDPDTDRAEAGHG